MTDDINVNEFFQNLDQQLAEPEPDEPVEPEPTPDEPAPEPEPELEPAAEAEADDRARDDKGRFVAEDDAVVERRLKEKDRVIGSMANEIGELRKLVEGQIEQASQPPPQDLSGVEQTIYESQTPTVVARQLAVQALQQQDQIAYERTIRAWHQVDEVGALMFAQEVQAVQLRNELEQQFRPQMESAQQYAARQSVEQAAASVAAKYPNLPAVLGQIDMEDPDTKIPPGILRDLADPATAAQGTEDLYFWAKGRYGDPGISAQADADAEDQQAARALKAQASVADTSSRVEDTGADHHHDWSKIAGREVAEDEANFWDFLITDPLTGKPVGR